MVNLNLLGLLYCTHAALPHLLAAAESEPRSVADVVNVSSVAGRVARLNSGVYNATKHGVGAFSESLRQEVTTRHVRVTLIEPGATATELAFHNRPEILEGMAQQFGGIEIMHAEDIAECIRYAVTQPRAGGGERDPGAADRAGALTIERVAVVGCSGSGKTTLAAALARALGVPHVELDSIYHQPGWTPLGDEEYRARVAEATEQRPAGWSTAITRSCRTSCGGRPTPSCGSTCRTPRSWHAPIRRTVRRTATREELWNGNREPFSNLWSLNPREVDHRLGGHPARRVSPALRGGRARPAVGAPALRAPALAGGGRRFPGRRDGRH